MVGLEPTIGVLQTTTALTIWLHRHNKFSMNKLIIISIVLYNGAIINLIGCNSVYFLLHLLQFQCSTRLGLIANLQ